jgi:hypothetical protein
MSTICSSCDINMQCQCIVGGLVNTLGQYKTVQALSENATIMHQAVRDMLLSAKVPISAEVEAAIEDSFPFQQDKRVTPAKGRPRSEVTNSSSKYEALFEANLDDVRTIVRHYLDDYLLFGIPLRDKEIALLTRNDSVSLSEAIATSGHIE